jgi:hypothetical protein
VRKIRALVAEDNVVNQEVVLRYALRNPLSDRVLTCVECWRWKKSMT